MSASAPTLPDHQVPELPYRKSSIVPAKPATPRRHTGNVFSDKLTTQQWQFINNYMQGDKPYEAAKKAGYAESTCLVAYDLLLNDPNVREEIQKRIERHFKDLEISEQSILRSTQRFANSNLLDYGYVDQSNGHFIVDLRNVPRELGYAIQEYSVDSQGRPRIKLVDKLAATALLGKFRGMGSEKVQLTGKDGAPLTIQALDAIVAQSVTINQQINNIAAPEVKSLPQTIDAVVKQ